MSQWMVLRIRPSWELKAEKELRAIGIPTMAPYRETWTRIRRGRPRKYLHALFPGYAFVSLEDIRAGWQAIQGALNGIEEETALADAEMDLRGLRIGDQVPAARLAIRQAQQENKIAYGLLPTSDNPAILRPEDVAYLASVADGKYQPGEDVPRLKVGDDVLVSDGPFYGFTGRILSVIRGKRATVEIKQVKIARGLEIPLANLEKV